MVDHHIHTSKMVEGCRRLKKHNSFVKKRVASEGKKRIGIKALKLAVALSLKLDGYDIVEFDKLIEFGGQKIRIGIFAEDFIGCRIAVWCISRASDLKSNRMALALDLMGKALGEDCTVAVAIPISLINYVDELIGLTYRIYRVDETGKVWLHDAGRPCISDGSTWKFADETGEEESEPLERHSSGSPRCSFYIA